jgi:FMN-dependent NADH-azoreductase
MKLLHIDSSVLGAGSASRALTADIVARQVKLHPGLEVIYRDLATDAALHLSPAHLAAWRGKR